MLIHDFLISFYLGSKIRDLLADNGMEFPLVEIQVQKYSTSGHEQKKEGKWVTRHFLQAEKHWTKLGAQCDLELCLDQVL